MNNSNIKNNDDDAKVFKISLGYYVSPSLQSPPVQVQSKIYTHPKIARKSEPAVPGESARRYRLQILPARPFVQMMPSPKRGK
jgi:hypothetical protein